MGKSYKGCKWLDKKKRKDRIGWTYAELQKMWRMSNRECKLNKWGAIKFKEWRDSLVSIEFQGVVL